jgi:hypothetical protein
LCALCMVLPKTASDEKNGDLPATRHYRNKENPVVCYRFGRNKYEDGGGLLMLHRVHNYGSAKAAKQARKKNTHTQRLVPNQVRCTLWVEEAFTPVRTQKRWRRNKGLSPPAPHIDQRYSRTPSSHIDHETLLSSFSFDKPFPPQFQKLKIQLEGCKTEHVSASSFLMVSSTHNSTLSMTLIFGAESTPLESQK